MNTKELAFSAAEIQRYTRHFPVIGLAGQKQLKQSRVLCIGAGGLGCPALQYLAASGVGHLGIIDGDLIELSNLQRQILFQTVDIGKNKANTARDRLLGLNPEISIQAYSEHFTKNNGPTIIKNYDVIIDATDNYPTRYLINTLSREYGLPLISASIYQFDAQLSVFNHQQGPCYQCLYATPPPDILMPNCAVGGVLGVLPGVVGALQANEVIKILTGIGTVLSGKLLSIDLLTMRFRYFDIEKQDCLGHPNVIFDKVSPQEQIKKMSVQQLEKLLAEPRPLQLIDVRESYEREICHIGGEHISLFNLSAHMKQFDKNILTIVYCKSGLRSAQACEILQAAGFKESYCLEGGIMRWIEQIDKSLPKY